jgi:translation initiation factor 1
MNKTASTGTLVYSTELGRICPGCGKALAQCACGVKNKAAVTGDGVVRVSRQSKGRGGKTVTLVKGLALDAAALAALAKQLRTACGAGGTVKDGVVEVQGDHCETILAALKKFGHPAKQAGG